jgi:DNA-binding response OmpR family regulator
MKAGARILVVDDDAEIRELTHLVLSDAGYAVSAVASGSEALKAARHQPFDLVLLDINMPEMDGWETLRLMQADEDVSSVPVVMFTVKNEVRDRIHGMQEGATDYITKPFRVDELLARVRRILETPPAERRPDAASPAR